MSDQRGTDGVRSGSGDTRPPDSPVITEPVRLLVPLVLTFGLYTAFHGTSSVGGGFQGGVVVAAGLILLAFAFGVTKTRDWLDRPAMVALATAGVIAIVAVAAGPLAFGGTFFDLSAYPFPKAVVYGIELVELGIATTVAATVLLLFLELAGGDDA
ncbi:MnhB domain-containing protein [Haloarculaceae archaeon H-GB2-1]|nr:MnhB domain-containing protein [Haloarculaceae archaeon H-GB1-1]MEA5386278.1 MnhB domain-containing protein [Haloarculaceae archaeon H-GB11]MEA5407781.1 MnhB domain-containing protein [Haloarculaceae archaeon H-GB2-1]